MIDADAMARIELGKTVRERLEGNPAALRIPSPVLEIFVVRGFLDAEECDGLIRLIDADRIPSQLLSPTEDPEFRTSESCNLDLEDPLARRVEIRLADLMGIDPIQSETIQGQRYAVGQQFKPHHDYFHPGEVYWDEMMRTGGQRTWTAMMFLNVPEGGGETRFPDANIKVTPRRGNLLAWNNLDGEGQPNRYSIHQGCPVTAGVKYVITKWYRERPWTFTDFSAY